MVIRCMWAGTSTTTPRPSRRRRSWCPPLFPLRPSIRLAALSAAHVIYVWTHDSLALGEDGPTHEPVEHVMSLRLIPHMRLIRPADANETAVAWKLAMESKKHPTALALTRQAVPTFDRTKYASAEGVRKGAYVFGDVQGTPDVILIGTGSELQLAVDAQEKLEFPLREGEQCMPCPFYKDLCPAP